LSALRGKRDVNPTYALKRLKRDCPDLADKVARGELSPSMINVAEWTLQH